MVQFNLKASKIDFSWVGVAITFGMSGAKNDLRMFVYLLLHKVIHSSLMSIPSVYLNKKKYICRMKILCVKKRR